MIVQLRAHDAEPSRGGITPMFRKNCGRSSRSAKCGALAAGWNARSTAWASCQSASSPTMIGKSLKNPKDIQHVILEMCEEVARRARQDGKVGRTVCLGVGYSKAEGGGGFHRSKTMERPTNITMDIYRACLDLFHKFYGGQTVRKLSVTLSNVSDDDGYQLDLFDPNYEKRRRFGYVMGQICEKYGSTALLRAVSYT